jgi:hypothetical protein
VVLAATCGALLAAGLGASALPALAAMRLDPAAVMRPEQVRPGVAVRWVHRRPAAPGGGEPAESGAERSVIHACKRAS